jgi:hypothetical protein
MQVETPFDKSGTIQGKKQGQIPEDLNLQPHRFESLKYINSAFYCSKENSPKYLARKKHF